MDPETTLEQLRDHMARIGVWDYGDCENIYELFTSLDQWLSRGGFLPVDWTR